MAGRNHVFGGARMGDVKGAQGRFSRVRETVRPGAGDPASSRAALRGQGNHVVADAAFPATARFAVLIASNLSILSPARNRANRKNALDHVLPQRAASGCRPA
jgi:hypothetical protein